MVFLRKRDPVLCLNRASVYGPVFLGLLVFCGGDGFLVIVFGY